MSLKLRKRREKLWVKENGKCYWCGCLTILPDRGEHFPIAPDNLATIDHLRSRLQQSRQEPNHGVEERTVLACFQCNHLRGLLDQKSNQVVTLRVMQDENKPDLPQ
jgi:hypothetical protein